MEPDQERQATDASVERVQLTDAEERAEPPPLPVADPVGEWLASIGMSQYTDAFRRNHVAPSHLQSLTDADLQSMGITTLGDRKAILESLAARQQETCETTEAEDAEAFAAVRKRRARAFDKGCLIAGAVLVSAWGLFCAAFEGIMDGPATMVPAAIVLCIAFYIYSLPAVIAFRKGHEHRWAILIGNWFFGFTGVVWLILLGYSIGLFGSGAALTLGYFAERD